MAPSLGLTQFDAVRPLVIRCPLRHDFRHFKADWIETGYETARRFYDVPERRFPDFPLHEKAHVAGHTPATGVARQSIR